METVALMRPHFAELGITRIARQTGLDTLGIPCFAAIRPNSRSIASNQGKGIDDSFAMASAVMEATEFAIAENPQVATTIASVEELRSRGIETFDPRRALPIGYDFSAEKRIEWVGGRALRDGRTIMVPIDMVALRGYARDLPGICQNTNGLASGNTPAEAIFHAVCELIERDAGTLWSLLDVGTKKARCLSPESFGDDVIDGLLARFESAGLAIKLFDQTADLGIPTILAVSGPSSGRFAKHFDVAAGSGTHPDYVRAALRAITEAAQTRVTAIAGARDDHRPDTYRLAGNAEAFELLAAEPGPCRPHRAPRTNDAGVLLDGLVATLAQGGVDDLVACALGGERYGVSVVRVVSDELEDRGPNENWRPGARALDALAGLS